MRICIIKYEKRTEDVLLNKLSTILEPISDEMFLIAKNFYGQIPFDEKTYIKNIKHENKRIRLFLIRVLNYMMVQIKISRDLIKLSKTVDVVIFFTGGATLLLPMLTTKFLMKKAVLIAAGSASIPIKKVHKKLFAVTKIVLYYIYRILENINYALSDRLVVESESGIDFLGLNRYKNKIFVSNMGVNLNLFKISEEDSKERNLIGYVGCLTDEKGVMNFVKAIPLILKEKKDLDFVIGGDGPLFEEIKNELNNNEIYDKVIFAGRIPHDELSKYLNELKLLVLPSYSEGLPNIILEAMACGTPVLATPVGGVPDVIRDGETGFIMENNSPECIAKNAISALEYPNLDEIVKKARELIEKEFTYEAAMERYRKILRAF
jgi:glycosyltransferase involved in cell wall biosynthesis